MATRSVKPTPRGKPSGVPFLASLVDVAAAAGLHAPIIYGGVERKEYIVETMGCGCAFLDYDNDGWLDIFVLSGTRFASAPEGATNRLYKNNRDGTFSDVTAKAGLLRTGWPCGVCAGDYDNDGFDDVFITYWGDNVLYHNNGDGTFTDVTKKAGVAANRTRWGAGCTWIDYDRDGKLDLFVSNYLDFDIRRAQKPGENENCRFKNIAVNCGPRGLPPGLHSLFRNNGDGTFTDVTKAAGIADVTGHYGLTAVAADWDEDGWPDIFVECDSTASLLLINNHDGTFREEGIERGAALSDDGIEQAGMGVGAGDYNLDSHLDIFKGHFTDDTNALYRIDGKGNFNDVTLPAGLGVETRFTGWGAGIVDLDNDGDIDILIVNMNEPPSLLRNELKGDNHWLKALLVGSTSNRSAIGASVIATYGGRKQAQAVLAQSSYLSVNDRRLHYGLGRATSADLEIRWPSGREEKIRSVAADQLVVVREGSGIIRKDRFERR